MVRIDNLMVRLTNDKKSRLEYYARVMPVSMSEVIQDYCKNLPKPSKIGIRYR
ncbi:MAG: DNA-binding protein [Okeania sp. SIO2B3]|nr:DNA-binding protein [Okeania sp. SIO2B3]